MLTRFIPKTYKPLAYMRYLCIMLLTSCLIFCSNATFAQKTPPKPPKVKPITKTKNMMFEGTLQKKPWSKSTQSFCAEGSEYYVLLQEDETEIVIRNESTRSLADYEGKKVTIEGKKETKIIKPSSNPAEQRPVSINPMTGKEDNFTCTILIVTKIK